MKNVLWITGVFPPISCGVGRQFKLAKYLPDYGWNPVVLAFGKSMFCQRMDEGSLEDVKHLEVHRTRLWESKLLQETLPIYLRRLVKFNPRWTTTPDPWLLWYPFAMAVGKELIKKRRAEHCHFLGSSPIDAIFSTADPWTCHLVALSLKRKFGLPWVADFRDFWTEPVANSYVNRPRVLQRLEERWQRAVMQEADWITAVNERQLETMRGKYPEIEGKSSVVGHGYDPADFEGLAHARSNTVCSMTYTGTLYGERTKGAEAFLQALKQFYEENPNAPLKVGFVGNCKPAEKAAKELGLWQVSFIGWMDRGATLGLLSESDVLLFILGDSNLDRHASPGKLYDYLGARKPILGVCPDGVAKSIIDDSTGGLTYCPSDIEGIKRGIAEMVESNGTEEMERLRPDKWVVEQHDVRRKAEEMAGVLEGVMR